METYDGHLYKGQDSARHLLAIIEHGVRENDALLVLACAAELVDLVGDAFFFHEGGRTAQLEVKDFLRGVWHDLAPPDTDKGRAIGERIGSAFPNTGTESGEA